jgi:hypothetical protein
MSTKLKALGLGLFAMAAMGAFGVMNAVAEGGGHFNVGAGGTEITAFEGPGSEHNLEFEADTGGIVECDVSEYHGGTEEGTVSSISVTPTYEECYTTGNETKFEVHDNNCEFEFTAVAGDPETEHNTVNVCPGGGNITITHPNCEIEIGEQTVSGVVYKTITTNGKHAITLESTTEVATKYEDGICRILGTNHTAEMFGSATVIAENANNEPVDLTATGAE